MWILKPLCSGIHGFEVWEGPFSSLFSQLFKVSNPGAVFIAFLSALGLLGSPMAPKMGLFGAPFGTF